MWSLAFPFLNSTDDPSSDEPKSEDPLFSETSSDNLDHEDLSLDNLSSGSSLPDDAPLKSVIGGLGVK